MRRLAISAFAMWLWCATTGPSFAAISFSDIQVYYVNGIQNTYQDGLQSNLLLKDALLPLSSKLVYNPIGAYYGTDPQIATNICRSVDPVTHTPFTFSLDLDHVTTFSSAQIDSAAAAAVSCLVDDLGELNASKVNEEIYAKDYEEFVIGNSNEALRSRYSDGWVRRAQVFLSNYLWREEPSIQVVVNTLTTKTINSLKANKSVLLVAHSQGNIAVNLAWVKLISTPTLSMKELQRVRILNVANTSRFSPHNHNATHDRDAEINRSLVLLGLHPRPQTAECTTGTCPFKVATPTLTADPALIFKNGIDSHSFVSTYLSTSRQARMANGATLAFKDILAFYANRLLRDMGYQNAAPAASFKVNPTAVVANQSTAFDASSSTDDETGVGIVGYSWDFGDGQVSNSIPDPTIAHAYAAPGTYQVTLTVTDDAGAQGSTSQRISVTPASTLTSSFFDDFLGTTLSPVTWTQEGLYPATATNGLATIACGAQISTRGKVTFSGNSIVAEGRFGGLVTFFRATSLILVDATTGDSIQIGDTDYGNTPGYIHRTGLFGLYTSGSGIFNLAQVGNENSVSVMKEYRLTLTGTSLKAERGDTLSAITETVTRTLPTSISGRTFYLMMGGGNQQFCPGTHDWVRITAQ